MSGYYSRRNYNQKPKYKPKFVQPEKPAEEAIKAEGVQTNFISTSDQGVQITMGEGIPCRLIPINPEDYPKLLALLKIPQNP